MITKFALKVTFSLLILIGNLMNSQQTQSKSSLYNITLTDAEGNNFKLERFKGKNLLIVNVASRCGYTSQYIDLQRLHDKHGKDVQILAIPCNDFGRQEPGTMEQIVEFCEVNYGIKFPILQKSKIKGNTPHPLYKWLSDPVKNGWNSELPTWNFCKYLINKRGELVGFYPSNVNPTSKEITSKL